jgi:predicted metal-dependent HD superfamily phosphohydrolase
MNHATAARFQELGHLIGLADAISNTAFANLVRHYGEAHRHYHNLTHIESQARSNMQQELEHYAGSSCGSV